MSRRIVVALALVAVSSTFSACAEPVTAPRKAAVSPSIPRTDAVDPGTCRSGWISTEGRCA